MLKSISSGITTPFPAEAGVCVVAVFLARARVPCGGSLAVSQQSTVQIRSNCFLFPPAHRRARQRRAWPSECRCSQGTPPAHVEERAGASVGFLVPAQLRRGKRQPVGTRERARGAAPRLRTMVVVTAMMSGWIPALPSSASAATACRRKREGEQQPFTWRHQSCLETTHETEDGLARARPGACVLKGREKNGRTPIASPSRPSLLMLCVVSFSSLACSSSLLGRLAAAWEAASASASASQSTTGAGAELFLALSTWRAARRPERSAARGWLGGRAEAPVRGASAVSCLTRP